MCTLTPLLFPITHKLLCRETFKCLACLLFFNNIFLSQGLRNESYPEFSIFGTEFTHIDSPPSTTTTTRRFILFYVTSSFFSSSSSSFCSSITLSVLIKSKPLDVWIMLACISAFLALQTSLRLAGPPAVPGSMLRMQGMAQWTISRKFPAADWTKCPKVTGKDIHWG